MRANLILLVGAALLLAGTARADTVTLRDGTVKEGVILRQDADGVTLEMRIGSLKGAVHIPQADIRKIERKPLPEDPTEAAAAKLRAEAEAKTGAEAAAAWVKLGDFYADRAGYSNLAHEAWRKAVAADPDHAEARKRLGHVKTESGWQAVDDERRARGLVKLEDDVWVKPAERAWLIDRKDKQDAEDGLRIGPKRAEDKFTKAEVEKLLKMRQIQEELARREELRVQHGESLLQRYGYYGDGGGFFVGPGYTPVYADGVGIASGDSEFFVGTVSSYPYYNYSGGYYGGHRRGWGYGGANAGYWDSGNAGSNFRRSYGYSPGFVYKNFAFGTNFNSGFGGYGGYSSYSGYSSGFGVNLSGGNKSFRYNVGIGGFGW
ncbi:MAG: hypothetical protein KIS92_09745 [Planctomycetota bacterium]|nr:hypothetical protein [Planctomycetota bacterium]